MTGGPEGASGAVPAVAFEVSTLLVGRPTGIAVYGEGLLRALRALRPDRPILQVYRWSRRRRRRFLPAPDLPARPYLTGLLLHRRAGLLHALDTRLPRAYRGPLVATLFDVSSAIPEARRQALSSPRFVLRKRLAYRAIARRADAVIAISRETRERFLAIERPRGPVVVVPPGIAPEFLEAGRGTGTAAPPPAVGRILPAGGRYLLVVGALHPRKNLEGAVGTFRRLRERFPGLRLLVSGEPGRSWAGSALRRDLEGDPAIGLLGYLERRDLAAACTGAAALVYLSHYEGFGLPVLEAMAAGAPVVASRRGGIVEAAGEAALLVDPDRPDEVDGAVAAVLERPDLAARLRERGRERASLFRWEEAARAVEEVHRKVQEAWRRSRDFRTGSRSGTRDG